MPYLGVKPAAITSATEAEIAGDLTVDTSTFHVDSTSNNVGIGTTSPSNFGGTTLQTNHGSTYSANLVSSGTHVLQMIASQTHGAMSMGARSNHHVAFTTNDTERMRILSGGGLTFNGDTATANALDDYEEGTFTPVIQHNTSQNSTFTSANGNYTKIGNTVTCQIRVDGGNTGTAGTFLTITGLPFTVSQGQSNQTIGIWGSNPSSQVGNVHGFNPPRLFKGGTDVTTQMTFVTAMLVYKI